MESLAFALDRLHAFLAEVREIAAVEFPYPDSQAALKILRQLLEGNWHVWRASTTGAIRLLSDGVQAVPQVPSPVCATARVYPSFDKCSQRFRALRSASAAGEAIVGVRR